jgi:hypothetical protein
MNSYKGTYLLLLLCLHPGLSLLEEILRSELEDHVQLFFVELLHVPLPVLDPSCNRDGQKISNG